ncbi:methylenetetrahydrofolate reductase [NAD(P)H] [Streptococcus suis]|uniref:methylenetetrahydrofolate reductase [NAD(P)H] n=1 Tax=Streptococcus suis TaxID=1307 RepID=UPI001EFF0A0E|nr:methylenetetrahydrofolate reductase [NAD(P)H] [Streptococcus suis]MCG9868053.1 methylenetetrahydrofolate reductase [NAD(P)H] [Streptococcus suis]MCG9903943.1 methylenetetrahydrofolate reductase [NAD(P)H] [Streptococcus suis]MCG9905863.1 methylenetetrahydrofolate reductase [NAD(P)H] [Streptococcus suis]MCG9930551.1 methylenetetrahydrofolate reductase [NAD(P)H] [Streptococcus suis]
MIGQTPSLSFEIFPPKPAVGNEKIIQTLDEMQGLAPHFISVTCSNNNLNVEETTVKLANHVRNELHIPTIAHLPAAYLTKEKVRSVLHSLDEIGVHQILALRGDIIEGLPPKEDFQYATDLISFIKEEAPHFDIIGACYPEVHPESPNSVSDIKNLKKKVDAGCSTLVTQLFFDNEAFYNFQEKCSLADIEVPIINKNQALRLLKTCENIRLPRKFKAILEKYEHNPESLRAAGLAYAVDQIVDLVTNDVAGIHLYTMNNAETARTIHQATHSLFKHYS